MPRPLLLLAALASPTLVLADSAPFRSLSTQAHAEPLVSQLIIKLKPASSNTVTSSVSRSVTTLGNIAGITLQPVRTMTNGATVAKLDTPVSAEEARRITRQLAIQPNVELVSPDYRRQALATPNDAQYGSQWALMPPSTVIGGVTMAGGANLQSAWDVSTGNTTTVIAIIDTGVLAHPDLSSKLLPGYDFISDSFVANDGDGRDSNASDSGDWVSSADLSQPICDGNSASDSSWHGTHVAGIAAASSNNSTDIAGVSWGSRILPVRVLGKCGGYDSDIIDAVRWSAGLHVNGIPDNPNPADIINLSLGSSGECTSATQAAFDEVRAAGVTIVAATGNDGDIRIAAPANCQHLIAVSAHGPEGLLATYANIGTGTTISAPGGGYGVDISGAITGSGLKVLSLLNSGVTAPSTYQLASYQGTSMATPHAAGVAALLRSVLPNATPDRIRQLLTSTARSFPSDSLCSHSAIAGRCGSGLLDAGAALQAASAALAANRAPTAATTPVKYGRSSSAMVFALQGTDADNDALTFEVAAPGLPAGASLDPDGMFVWKEPLSGNYTLNWKVSDGITSSSIMSTTLNVAQASSQPLDAGAGDSVGGSADTWLLLLTGGLLLWPRRKR